MLLTPIKVGDKLFNLPIIALTAHISFKYHGSFEPGRISTWYPSSRYVADDIDFSANRMTSNAQHVTKHF